MIDADVKLLTAQEEVELATKAQGGDVEARNRMLLANQGLVCKFARKYSRVTTALTFEDFVSEGNIGMSHCIGKFDPAYGVRFSTYATFWIRQAMQYAIAKVQSVALTTTHQNHWMYRRYERFLNDFYQSNKRKPDLSEISTGLGWKEKVIQSLIDHARATESKPYLECDSLRKASADSEVKASQLDMIRTAFRFLDERSVEIIKMRYGIDRESSMTMEEVAQVYGVTKQRIDQIEKKAILKMQGAIKLRD